MPVVRKRYLAIDAGPTTGICVVDESDLTDPRFKFHPKNLKLDSPKPHKQLYEYIEMLRPELIICERFQFRPNQQGADIKAANYQGVVELFAEQEEVPLVLQNPSLVGKTAFWSDDNKRVRSLSLYDHKATPHGMDAARHFLYYYTFNLKGRYFLERLPNNADE